MTGRKIVKARGLCPWLLLTPGLIRISESFGAKRLGHAYFRAQPWKLSVKSTVDLSMS